VRGNCLAACVASILEVDLAELAGVHDSQSLWAWLREHRPAVGMMNVQPDRPGVPLGELRPYDGYSELPGKTPWIATVKSPRTPHYHCVVMVGADLAWDPHPQRDLGVGDSTARPGSPSSTRQACDDGRGAIYRLYNHALSMVEQGPVRRPAPGRDERRVRDRLLGLDAVAAL
jgi:hypothetical protein